MVATAVSAAKGLIMMEMFNYEEPTADHEFIGTWHIYEMEPVSYTHLTLPTS